MGRQAFFFIMGGGFEFLFKIVHGGGLISFFFLLVVGLEKNCLPPPHMVNSGTTLIFLFANFFAVMAYCSVFSH